MKNRGDISISYNELAKLLGLEENSIRKIYEKDPGEEVLHVLHDDSRYSFELGKGAVPPSKRFDALSTLDHSEYMRKCIMSGLKVNPSSIIEYIFGIQLYPYQKEALNLCESAISKRHYWDRQNGATTCAIYEAIYLSYFCQKHLFILNNNMEQQTAFIKRIIDLFSK